MISNILKIIVFLVVLLPLSGCGTPIPGNTSITDPEIKNIAATLVPIAAAYAANNVSCVGKIIDTRIVGSVNGVTDEEWTVDVCGTKVVVPFQLNHGPSGETGNIPRDKIRIE